MQKCKNDTFDFYHMLRVSEDIIFANRQLNEHDY